MLVTTRGFIRTETGEALRMGSTTRPFGRAPLSLGAVPPTCVQVRAYQDSAPFPGLMRWMYGFKLVIVNKRSTGSGADRISRRPSTRSSVRIAPAMTPMPVESMNRNSEKSNSIVDVSSASVSRTALSCVAVAASRSPLTATMKRSPRLLVSSRNVDGFRSPTPWIFRCPHGANCRAESGVVLQ